jgi:hypothetical protein
LRLLLVVALLALSGRPAAGDVLMNEVLYDPAGIDEGAEFVELWNPGDAAASLAGVTIEAGDGATGAWSEIWRGAAGDSIPPRAPYLVSGPALTGALQNGPDAVRLLRDGVVLDLLGYGPLATSAMYEGAPAPDAPSGQSLARRADGHDTDVNAADWAVEASPTPGRANHPEIGVAFRSPGLLLDPAVAWPGEPVAAVARVRCAGREGLPEGSWGVTLERAGTPGLPLAEATGGALAAGDSADLGLSWTAPPDRGAFRVRAVVRAFAAGSAPPDSAETEARSGPGDAVVGEFAFKGPAGEWVEIECLTPVADLGGLLLSDRAGRLVPVDAGGAPRPAPAGARYVLAESPASVRSRFALPESVVLGLGGPWPALNDADQADGRADIVRLFGPGATIWDAVPYASSYADRGGSVERLSPDLPSAARGTWAESIDPSGGTPGRPNSLSVAPGSGGRGGALLAAATRAVLRRGGAVARPVLLRVTAEARGRRLRIEVRDLRGRTRRVLARGQRFAGEAALLWDGRDDRGTPVPPGIYTVRAETEEENDAPARATVLALWVAEEATR